MTTKKELKNNETCPAQALLKSLSGKWKPEIFRLAVDNPLRFSVLKLLAERFETFSTEMLLTKLNI